MTERLSAKEQIEAMRAARVMKSVMRADKRIDKVEDRISRGELRDEEKAKDALDEAKRMNPRHFNALKKKQ